MEIAVINVNDKLSFAYSDRGRNSTSNTGLKNPLSLGFEPRKLAPNRDIVNSLNRSPNWTASNLRDSGIF